MKADDNKNTEEFKVSGSQVKQKVKEIIEEGSARRITIKASDGRTILEIPLTVGVLGAVVAPALAAVAAVAAVVTECTVVVERRSKKEDEADKEDNEDSNTV